MNGKMVQAPNGLNFEVTEQIYTDMITPPNQKKFPLPRVIPLMLTKGGVGKTALTGNLGIALGKRGKRVLLIDLDHQGNLTQFFDKEDEGIFENSIYEVMLYKKQITEAAIEINENVFLVPACHTLTSLDIDLSRERGTDIRLQTQIELVRDYFDYVLIDCPPSMDTAIYNAMIAATDIILPWNPDPYSNKAVKRFFLELTKTEKFHNAPIGRFNGIIVNKVNKVTERTNAYKAISATVEELYPNMLFSSVIPEDTKLKESVIIRESVITHAPYSTVSLAIQRLADELIAQEV